LQSLLTASEETPEVLVVDNASTDGTADFVRRAFPDVRVVAQEHNRGYGAACNVGVLSTDTEYVAILNQDVISRDGWIERLVAALEADPAAALATPRILFKSDPGRVNACGNSPHYTGITTCRGYNRPAEQFVLQEELAAVSGAAFVARKAAFQALGGFDPLFFLYLEDTDLSLRAALAGYRCLLVPDAAVLHEFEPRFSTEKIAFLERDRHTMLLKIYRWRTLLALAPALLLAEAAVVGYSLLRGPSCLRAKLGAYRWVAAQLPTILSRRRQVQAQRRVSDRALLARFTADLELDELGHPLGRLAIALINPLFRAWFCLVRASVAW
jgi:GT2 family glycosyltransferase